MFEGGYVSIGSLFYSLKTAKLREFERLWYLISSQDDFDPYDWRDHAERRLLHIAVMVQDLQILDLLEKAKINAKDNRGYTALHYAAMIRKSGNVVRWLVNHEIDVTIQSDQGYTAYDIVEGLWQVECNRLFQQKSTNKGFFVKGFLEKIGVLFNPSTSTSKIRDFLRENSFIKKFLQQHQLLNELMIKKILMEQVQCPKQKTMDFSLFLEPKFLSFGRPVWEDAYWYNIPPASPDLTTDKLHEMQFTTSQPLLEKDKLWEESALGLSRLYEESEIIQPHKMVLEQKNVTPANELSELSEALHVLDINSSTQTLTSSTSSSANENKASIMRGSFFEERREEDEFSEYSLVSTPTHTD